MGGVRIVPAVIGAVVVTFGLLFLMQLLIATGKRAVTEEIEGRIVDFVRVEREETVERKERKPERPPTPDQPPPDMPEPQMDDAAPEASSVGISPVRMDGGVSIDAAFGFSAVDGDYLPIVKVAPVYPRRAQERGIEGYVLVEFTVTKTGTVINPRVVEAEPPNWFERAALQAVTKFKYKPRVVNGEPIDTHGVQNLIRFELEDA